jgi:hypothetical protein
MSDDEVGAKFLLACRPRLGPARAEAALEMLWNLESQKDLSGLFAAFAQA